MYFRSHTGCESDWLEHGSLTKHMEPNSWFQQEAETAHKGNVKEVW